MFLLLYMCVIILSSLSPSCYFFINVFGFVSSFPPKQTCNCKKGTDWPKMWMEAQHNIYIEKLFVIGQQ